MAKAAGTADGVSVIDMSALSAAVYTSAGLCPNSGDYTSTTSKDTSGSKARARRCRGPLHGDRRQPCPLYLQEAKGLVLLLCLHVQEAS